jgi:NitT/TauT family transport system substrate-binding protein
MAVRTEALSRRRFLALAGAAGAAALPGRAAGQAPSPTAITAAHSVSTFAYAQHLVAREKKLFEEEGVTLDQGFLVPAGRTHVGQALASGRALFALGDSIHPLKISELGKDAVILFATDTRCAYANIVVRKDLHDAGLTGVEKLGALKRPGGGKWIIAATAMGSGTHAYGAYVLDAHKAADGRPLGSLVEWVGGGTSAALLTGLKAGKFDAIMAVPEWLWLAEDRGLGRTIYSVQEERTWSQVFGGPLPVTVGYCLRETVEKMPDTVQGYVTACYRAQQWIQKATEAEIADLLHKPYLDSLSKDELLRSIRYYRGIFDWDLVVEERDYNEVLKIFLASRTIGKEIPFERGVEMSFVRKAHQKGA